MKYRFLAFLLVSVFTCFLPPLQASFVPASSKPLINEKKEPTDLLLTLCSKLGMPQGISSLSEINDWAQKNLLRKGERWETQEEKYLSIKEEILPLLEELGFTQNKEATSSTYEGAIVHGALLPTLRLRLSHLIEAWKKNVRFSSLYFFTGCRYVEPTYENKETFAHSPFAYFRIRSDWKLPDTLPETEYEVAKLVWDQADVPEGMKESLSVYFINAPAKKNEKTGKLERPTTQDTIETWLQTKPPQGVYLAVSNAPYRIRQDALLSLLTYPLYTIETIGPEVRQQERVSIILDELARAIHALHSSSLAERS